MFCVKSKCCIFRHERPFYRQPLEKYAHLQNTTSQLNGKRNNAVEFHHCGWRRPTITGEYYTNMRFSRNIDWHKNAFWNALVDIVSKRHYLKSRRQSRVRKLSKIEDLPGIPSSRTRVRALKYGWRAAEANQTIRGESRILWETCYYDVHRIRKPILWKKTGRANLLILTCLVRLPFEPQRKYR